MTPLSSATNTSLKVGLLRLPSPAILHNQNALDRWFYNLRPEERGRFTNYINALVDAQPPIIQQRIKKIYAQITSTNVGLGWVGSLVTGVTTAVVQAGTSIYQGRQQADLQQRLSGQALGTQAQIAAIQTAAQKGIEEAKLQAQKEAAEIIGTTAIVTGKQAAEASITRTQMILKTATPIIIGVAGLGMLFFFTRKKKR